MTNTISTREDSWDDIDDFMETRHKNIVKMMRIQQCINGFPTIRTTMIHFLDAQHVAKQISNQVETLAWYNPHLAIQLGEFECSPHMCQISFFKDVSVTHPKTGHVELQPDCRNFSVYCSDYDMWVQVSDSLRKLFDNKKVFVPINGGSFVNQITEEQKKACFNAS